MFEEYLQCKGEWLNSTIVLNAKRSQVNQMIGENRYTTFKDLKAKLGLPAAKAIRASKKEQQKTQPADLPPLWKKHPDLDIEDTSVVLRRNVRAGAGVLLGVGFYSRSKDR